jgi:hypothetical protein
MHGRGERCGPRGLRGRLGSRRVDGVFSCLPMFLSVVEVGPGHREERRDTSREEAKVHTPSPLWRVPSLPELPR